MGFGVHLLLFCLLRFGSYSAFTFFLKFVFPGDLCVTWCSWKGPDRLIALKSRALMSSQAPAVRFCQPLSVFTRSVWGLRGSLSSQTPKHQRDLQTCVSFVTGPCFAFTVVLDSDLPVIGEFRGCFNVYYYK